MTFKDHFSGHAADYARARPVYPEALYAWLAEQCRAHERAWDCATGNGQAAVALAAHFREVIATDASDAQIANAVQKTNVTYRVAPAEDSGLDAGSCDLITVGQALHWFDQAAFHAEVRRVARPGALLAAWSYHLTRVSESIDRVIDVFDGEIIRDYWPPERRHIDARYEDLPFPFERIPFPQFAMQCEWTLAQFLDYIGTWSAVQRYRKAKGHDPVTWMENELAAFWARDERKRVSWPLFGLVGVVQSV